MMYLQAPTAGNSVFGPFTTSFVVILGHFEPEHALWAPTVFRGHERYNFQIGQRYVRLMCAECLWAFVTRVRICC